SHHTSRSPQPRRSRAYGRGPSPRIPPPAGHDRSKGETEETQPRSGAIVWPFSDGRTETVYRPELSDSARSDIHGLRRLISGRPRDTGDRHFVPGKIPPADGDVAIRLVG